MLEIIGSSFIGATLFRYASGFPGCEIVLFAMPGGFSATDFLEGESLSVFGNRVSCGPCSANAGENIDRHVHKCLKLLVRVSLVLRFLRTPRGSRAAKLFCLLCQVVFRKQFVGVIAQMIRRF